MKSNVDVEIIDNNINDLYKILNRIDKGHNIIYSNCTFDIKIGYETIKERKFDSFLYNEESDLLLLLKKDNENLKEKIIKHLENRNKMVSEVTFLPLNENNAINHITPDIYVCRDKNTLEKILNESIRNNIDYCDFYPELSSYFMLGYRTSYRSDKKEIDGRFFKGILKLDNKYILLVNQKYNIDSNGNSRNLTQLTVEELFKKYNIKYKIIYSNFVENNSIKKLIK